MRTKSILFPFLFLCCILTNSFQSFSMSDSINIIPIPQHYKMTGKGNFLITPKTVIVYSKNDKKMERNARFLSEYINQLCGFAPKILTTMPSSSKKNIIVLSLNSKLKTPESYQLSVSKKAIKISGKDDSGVFYGIQSLRKMLNFVDSTPYVQSITIEDSPRFAYRGMMLDVSRHFKSVDFVKRYIDLLALHNLNHLHLHLTDDQGWRIEIKAFPKLTEIGSKRSETVIGKNTGKYDSTPHEGYYTQQQIKDLVDYAAARHITIVPEIDLPGHMMAALAAYPEYGCKNGGPYAVGTKWGVYENILNVGNEATFDFLEKILTEVIGLFPSKYIHIGGDEVPKIQWEKDPDCQKLIQKLGLKDGKKHKKEFYLQSYVTERIEKFLNAHGRKIIGWDEILEGTLAPNATVMSWRGVEGGIEAAKMGHDAIMTPSGFLYFDHYQTLNTKNEPLAIGGYSPVERVYSYEPVPGDLTEKEKKHIIGVQANLWTEYVPTDKHAEYMTIPRLAALCEIQWSDPKQKSFDDFARRLPHLLSIYKKLGYNYAPHIFIEKKK